MQYYCFLRAFQNTCTLEDTVEEVRSVKQIIRGSMLAVTGVCIILIVVYMLPRQINVSEKGVLYQLGEENMDFLEPVTLHMKGRVIRTIKGTQTFKGY